MGFQHPALGQAAASGELSLLAQAAGRIGAPDPIQALQHVDCDPGTVHKQVDRLEQARGLLTEAADQFDAGVSTVDSGWSGGGGHAAFVESAAEIRNRYGKTKDKTEDSVAAGRNVARTLDSVATTVAKEATTIAGSVVADSQRVLDGEGDESIEAVNAACREIVLTVQDNLKIIGELAEELASHV
ncbi:hypothetical protein ACQPZU_05920 [Saccharomonospora azurea]|uniref:hypothetical protein n=1 Tax=Saccharomonospora azurea TaxID=40988 RepID=UPI003D8FBCB0